MAVLKSDLKKIGDLVRLYFPDLSFSIFEIGARYVGGPTEPFYPLLEIFPKSKLIGFEPNIEQCQTLNDNAPVNAHYYPVALSLSTGEQTFYVTNDGACSSLYKPNTPLLSKYVAMEDAEIKEESTLKVMSLDDFVDEYQIGAIDFIKIDVQGAELDVFQGGAKTLKDLLFIVSEVDFIPLYVNQPLFGEVSSFFVNKGYMLHKFLGFGGRTLKPVILNDDQYCCSQAMWSDVIFIKDIQNFESLTADQLLKLGILALIYDSPDLTFYCFQLFDKKQGTDLHRVYAHLGSK